MRTVLAAAMLLVGCAPVSPEALYRAPVQLSIASAKPPHAFATCVAGALPDAGQVMNEGEHYWLSRQFGGASFERWDFTPAANGGSVAEKRSGRAMASYGTDRVRRCAE